MFPPWALVVIEECGEPLVDLADFNFALEPAYFKAGLSESPRMLMRAGTAERLAEIQKGIAPFRFKIWDAWRPRDVQQKLHAALYGRRSAEHPDWSEEELAIEVLKYVNDGSDERIIPPHATGGTADLTLVDREGAELDMGTPFDHFGIEAAPQYFEEHGLDQRAIANRALLRDAMLSGDFCPWPYEWWHFEYGTQNWALTYGKPAALYGLTNPQ